jgi:hypothetical protein
LKTRAGAIDAFVRPENRPSSNQLGVSGASCQALPLALQRRTTATKQVIVPRPKIIQANVPCFVIIQLETIVRVDPSSAPFVVSRRDTAELPESGFRAISEGQLARTRATAEPRPFTEPPARRRIQQVRPRTRALQAGQASKLSFRLMASDREKKQSNAHTRSQRVENQPMAIHRRLAGPQYVRMRRRDLTPVRFASIPTPLEVIAIMQRPPAIMAGRAMPALSKFSFRPMTADAPSENLALSPDRRIGDNPPEFSGGTAEFRRGSVARRFPAWAPGWRGSRPFANWLGDNRAEVFWPATPTLMRKTAWARPTMKPAMSLSARQVDAAVLETYSVVAKAASTGQTVAAAQARTASMPANGRRLRWVTEKMPWAP